MKNKKGFTLIELLAIIVILAIIAVITVPIILNIIENSKKGAATDSAYGYKDAVNKWYVSQLSKSDSQNLLLNGTYIVTDGNFENNEIPVSGDRPSNGYLNYSNNTLTSGCLTIGDYKVVFVDGGSSTVKGKCAEVLYFTYDSTATANKFGQKNSIKLSEPDESWKYYIKETTLRGVSSYGVELTKGEDTIQLGGIFDTLEACNAMIEVWGSQISSMNPQCKALENKTLYEVFGVDKFGTENAVTFSLKPNDYANSVNTLKVVYPSCNVDAFGSAASCQSSPVSTYINDAYGRVDVYDAYTICYSYGFGLTGCSAL